MAMITIIGAGPAGNYSAYLLAKQGFEVRVIEEHSKIGLPVQCAGIVTNDLKEFFDDESFVLNKAGCIKIFSPDRKFACISLKNPDIIIDRAKFDEHIANMAKRAGAKYLLNHRFVGFEESTGCLILSILDKKTNEIKKIKTKLLVGADGPMSYVAKAAGLFGKRQFFTGIQYSLRLKTENAVHTFLLPKGFGWIIPETKNTARVGIVTMKDASRVSEEFMKEIVPDYKKRMISMQAGLVPLYDSSIRTQKGRVLLVGDAACQTKATTAGGIIQSLKAARALAKAIKNKASYEKEWKKEMENELKAGLLVRKILNKLSSKDYNCLVKAANQKKIKRILQNNTRENIALISAKMLAAKPSLLLFIRKLF